MRYDDERRELGLGAVGAQLRDGARRPANGRAGTVARVPPERERLVMYGAPSDAAPLEWEWVDGQLRTAGTYWVVPNGDRRPHPRPVWGVWQDELLHLSIGSPVISRLLRQDTDVVVHLDSGVDVVVVEGSVAGRSDDALVIDAYDEKYDWRYTVDEYGPLTRIAPRVVMAWRSAGWAGRDGFQQTCRWRF